MNNRIYFESKKPKYLIVENQYYQSFLTDTLFKNVVFLEKEINSNDYNVYKIMSSI